MSLPPRGGAEIVCLRHAESENVLAGASGALPLSPLTERGRDQACRAAADPRLAGVRLVYASTALRARQTAELLAGELGGEVVLRPDLVEIGIGDQEGVVDAALRRETADVLAAWVVDGDLDRRVADGETGHEVLDRVRRTLAAVAAEHAGGRVALVGHVGSLTLAVSVLCGLGGSVWGAPLPHAVPFVVAAGGDRWRCDRWPDARPD
jgi:alpha-ribazole phosphatase/probable phosphoglycerate mutase